MDLRQSETWQRHQLATTERMQADISRYTRPIISAMGISSLSYILTWGPLITFWDASGVPLLLLLAVALSACIVTLTAPAFALAVGIESYFTRRLRVQKSVAP